MSKEAILIYQSLFNVASEKRKASKSKLQRVKWEGFYSYGASLTK